jgi:hypothetical protein
VDRVMGESAQRGYEEAERQAFRALPFGARLRANIVACLVIGSMAAFILILGFGWFII